MNTLQDLKIEENKAFSLEANGDLLVNITETTDGLRAQHVGQLSDNVLYFMEPRFVMKSHLNPQLFDGKVLSDFCDGSKIHTLNDLKDVLSDTFDFDTEIGNPDQYVKMDDSQTYKLTYLDYDNNEKIYEFSDGNDYKGVVVTDFDSALDFAMLMSDENGWLLKDVSVADVAMDNSLDDLDFLAMDELFSR